MDCQQALNNIYENETDTNKLRSFIRFLLKKNQQLDKALDKICEEIAIADKMLHTYTKGKYISKEKWREYALAEAEEE